MTLRDLAKVKLTANREKSAKLRFERDLAKKKQRLSTKPGKRNRGQLKTKAVEQEQQTDEGSIQCMGCHMSWQKDQILGTGSVWILCDASNKWTHKECCTLAVVVPDEEDEPFLCPEC